MRPFFRFGVLISVGLFNLGHFSVTPPSPPLISLIFFQREGRDCALALGALLKGKQFTRSGIDEECN